MVKLIYLFGSILCLSFSSEVCAKKDMFSFYGKLSIRIDKVSFQAGKLKRRFKKLDDTVETLKAAMEKFVGSAKTEVGKGIKANIKTALDSQTAAALEFMENEKINLRQSVVDLNEKFDNIKTEIQMQVTAKLPSNFNQVSENLKSSIGQVENKLEADMNATIFRLEALEEKCLDPRAGEIFTDTVVRIGTSQAKDNRNNSKIPGPEQIYALPKKLKIALRSVFVHSDTDKSNTVSSNEFDKFMSKNFNLTEQELIDWFKEGDSNGNGEIDVKEHLQSMSKRFLMLRDKKREASFKAFDMDGNGFVSAAELKSLFAKDGIKSPDEESHIVMRVRDINRDGKIDYEEFVEMTDD